MPVGLKFLKWYFERWYILKNNEDDFRVRMGKPRTQKSGKAETYLKRVLRTVNPSRMGAYGRGQAASYSHQQRQKLGTRQAGRVGDAKSKNAYGISPTGRRDTGW